MFRTDLETNAKTIKAAGAGGANAAPDAAVTPDAAAGGRARDDGRASSAGESPVVASPASATPFVSMVVPCFNEERFVRQTLEGLAAQYEPGRFEIIVADGMSTDATRAVVAEFAGLRPEASVRVIDNPARSIPAALNLAVAAARGEIVARMDAHAVPSANYVRRCVGLLGEGAAEVVGASCLVRPGAETSQARAVALAVSHPFGIGDAKYRLPGSAPSQLVDTVAFGVFRKELWRALGGFDEGLLTNEDYDFNYRVRRGGGRVLLDASEHCLYFARPTLGALARQYLRYGSWKARMLRLHPRSVRARHAVAPAFVAALVALPLAALAWPPALWGLLAVAVAYASLSLFCAARLAGRAADFKLLPFVALAFLVIHCAWGAGFWAGLAIPPRGARGGGAGAAAGVVNSGGGQA